MQSSRQVKEKALRYSYLAERPAPEENTGGFQIRDMARFFVVDIILVLAVRLLRSLEVFPNVDVYVLTILGSKVVLLLYLVWLIRDRRNAWPETGASTTGPWWGWPVAVLLYAGFYPLLIYADRGNFLLLTRVYEFFGLVYQPQPQDVLFLVFTDIVDAPVRMLLVFFTVVAGPCLEELAFRGVGMDAGRRAWGVGPCILLTSLLFGLYHFNITVLLPLSILGVVFALIRVVTGSLWTAVFAHCLHNGITLFLHAHALDAMDRLRFW